MRAIVYVEGPSDRAAMEALLRPTILAAQTNGVGIRFVPQGGKAAILKDSWRKAADHLADNPDDWVFALPDLYPMSRYAGTEDAHSSFEELSTLLTSRFKKRAAKTGVSRGALSHFRVHCLKHDLEALILAAPEHLKRRLGTTDRLAGRWRTPVEDQDDGKPPKRIVEALFAKYKKWQYTDTIDAPWILERTPLASLLAACPQQFAPFVADIESLARDKRL